MKSKNNLKKRGNNSKIKIQIICKFIISSILSAMISFAVIIFSIFMLEHTLKQKYTVLINWYNSSVTAQLTFGLIFILLFCANTFWIFMRMMNEITDTLNELSYAIAEIAEGKLDHKINIHQKNELGKLAEDINVMSLKLRESALKEKKWNQERYNMITNLSHDLKTPMVSIMGYVDFIADKRYGSEEELDMYCDIVKRKTKELNQNINQLFQLSKISSCDYKITKQKVNIKQFAEQILMEYIPEFLENQLDYRIRISSEIMVNADIDSLKRIYENIISNTIKYAADGKYFDIEAMEISNGVKMIFRNYGNKIEDKELSQIFEKFYRQKNNSEKEGSGCGLYIIKKIVELHEGEISINSNDEYTEFIIVFPG